VNRNSWSRTRTMESAAAERYLVSAAEGWAAIATHQDRWELLARHCQDKPGHTSLARVGSVPGSVLDLRAQRTRQRVVPQLEDSERPPTACVEEDLPWPPR